MILTIILIIITFFAMFLSVYCHENKIISDRQYRTYFIICLIIAMLLSTYLDSLNF